MCNDQAMAAAIAAPPGCTITDALSSQLAAVEHHMRGMLARELGGYDPALHADVDDLAGTYLDRPGWALLVAVDAYGGVAGTASVRPGGPAPQHVPGWLAQRYADGTTGQVCRVWVDPGRRRAGVGRALALAAMRRALAEGYDPVCLHTNASVPGALAFWRSVDEVVEVHDARPDDPWSTVHFEVDPVRLQRT
jgi:ribosomal protein S18 acetylase RimI-like enzyme